MNIAKELPQRRPSARCPFCHGVQHIRKDGTFGVHHLWHGHDYRGICPGAGLTPEDAAKRDAEIMENFVNG